MVQKLQLVDDIDGTMATDTITFAFDGERYKIDLSAENITELTSALAPFIKHAQVIGKKRTNGEAVDLDAVRYWARSHGFTVADRGRISQDIMNAYKAGHSA